VRNVKPRRSSTEPHNERKKRGKKEERDQGEAARTSEPNVSTHVIRKKQGEKERVGEGGEGNRVKPPLSDKSEERGGRGKKKRKGKGTRAGKEKRGSRGRGVAHR